ncbi:PREDICTED: matrix metalloproteinase-14 isoform X3 [Trachymyrmex septentrionalis]|uniref:matrix metalloproteinase-14 isoform X3 n=1 Tax=Trachymyrmex septentrionalis TaxID=34720 RepID=UPI00084F7BA0|nr:PREDICTED: matrix metalloproteinase-14 isoform X3 [Trachymyrmex septentrionalis]
MTRWTEIVLQRQGTNICLIAFLVLYANTEAAPTDLVVSDNTAANYLAQYGYLPPINPENGAFLSEDKLTAAIEEFQAFAGLNITGELNEETAKLMATPRCGVKDKVGPAADGRSKRYALQGSRWRTKNLTYKISKYPTGLNKQEVEKEIANAFSVWTGETDLTFTRKTGHDNVHIEIRFEVGEHGDGDPFDGPGGTLAHAYFPVYGGDAHFDDSERWTIRSYRGTNLFQVAAHEFGHSLGLSHSDVKSALMAPFYRGYDPHFTLDQDDVSAIQALYGTKTKSPRGSRPPPSAEEDPELCKDPKIDAMFNTKDGEIIAFKGKHYWKLTDDGVASGYPRRISSTWKELPSNIDAAFTYRNGKTYFFKGTQYWRYINTTMDGDYPKEISDGFTGIPDNIDAATVWTGNGKIYFYKGTKFWRFDPASKPPVRSSYPKLIQNWEGIPNHINAAVTYKGYTYFFQDNAYYRFNDRLFKVDDANPAFPRSTAYWWFGCKSANKGTLGGTDELVTSSNHHHENSGASVNSLHSLESTRQLLLSIMTVIIARFIVAT